MKELDLYQSQAITATLDSHFVEIGLSQDHEFKHQIFLGEVKEYVEARTIYLHNPTPENYAHMIEEYGDVLYCLLSSGCDYSIDANQALSETFTKIFGRVNREHIGQIKEETGLDGVQLYKEAKKRHDSNHLIRLQAMR